MSHELTSGPDRDPLVGRLAELAPSLGGLNRDSLLFQAGRASVRPSRLWPLLVFVLVGLNLATLATLWTNRSAQIVHEASARPVLPAVDGSPPPVPVVKSGPKDHRYLPWRQRVLNGDSTDWPDSTAMAERSAEMSPYILSVFGSEYGLRSRSTGRGLSPYEMK